MFSGTGRSWEILFWSGDNNVRSEEVQREIASWSQPSWNTSIMKLSYLFKVSLEYGVLLVLHIGEENRVQEVEFVLRFVGEINTLTSNVLY